ncbi:hypothetical protein E2C01_101555 [Portunus trituberculatus]|uniref:Uncharacterized protein n=1 Tax=Portunus trituberculatus TaxID=210409 RepID=A0A5B7KF19_PORTR|nr:hypothetical protein [Portunus trituberculatus]
MGEDSSDLPQYSDGDRGKSISLSDGSGSGGKSVGVSDGGGILLPLSL